jgi:hypothetical protein
MKTIKIRTVQRKGGRWDFFITVTPHLLLIILASFLFWWKSAKLNTGDILY